MRSAERRTRIKRVPAIVEPSPARRLRLGSKKHRIALVVAVVVAIAIPLGLLAHYRMSYVASRNALVKGYITNVGAQIDGVVTGVEVDTGQQVHAGQILARFEDHQLQAAVQRARSRLEKATRELEVEHSAIEQERRRLRSLVSEASARAAAAKAQVEAAESQADDAKLKHELRESLAQSGVITKEELQSAVASRRTTEALGATARADAKAAEAARQLAQVESDGLSVREQHLVVLEADVQAFKAEVALAEADLQAAVIRAPSDGWIVRRIAEPGVSVVVGQPIIALWIGKEIWVEAWIDESDLSKVKVGNAARVTVKSYPRRVFTGTVETIAVSTDFELPDAAVPQARNDRMRTTPVVCVRVRLQESDGLFPGLSAEVGIRKNES